MVSPGVSGESVSPADLAARVDEIMAEWNKSDSPGCAVGVVSDGELVFKRGYGLANLDHGILISPTTVFDIGSTSKQFTAAAVALLAESGQLSLDDDIRRHLPEMPDYGKPITVRHLIYHTSGIRDYLTVMWLAGLESHDVYELDDVVQMIARQKRLNFEPGSEHLYTNSGYILLAAIAERVAGRSMNELLREQAFKLLDMDDTQVYDDRARIIPRRATGYSKNRDGELAVDHFYNFAVPGDGQVYTTVEDLARWDRVFYQGGVGGVGFVEGLLRRGVLNDGEEINYAFGLGHGEYKGLRTVQHGGAWGGFRAELMRFPEHRLSVICLCNFGEVDATALAGRIAEVFLGDRISEPSASGAPAEAESVSLGADVLSSFEGAFMSRDSGSVIQFVAADGALQFSSFMSGRTYRLESVSEALFHVVEPPRALRVRFETADAGRRVRLKEPTQDEGELFDEIELVEPSAEDLAAYTGKFYSEELDVVYGIRHDGGRLVLTIGEEAGDEQPMKPATRDLFFARFLRVTFERAEDGFVNGFEVDAGRVRGIAFKVMKSKA